MDATFTLNGARVTATLLGALWWPDERALLVADLHLEKASSYAPKGRFLPPYDTGETLARLEALIRRFSPTRIVCLGDSFHDTGAEARLGERDRRHLSALMRGRDWVWITGNHDPHPPAGIGGDTQSHLTLRAITLRHQADPRWRGAEISGHFHPKASITVRGKHLSARCYAEDGRRLVMPAFGALTGGLSVEDPAIARLFPNGRRLHLIGRKRVVSTGGDEAAA